MGVVNATIKVRNVHRPEPVIELPAKVDTAAILLVLPQSAAQKLELPFARTQTVKYANEECAERDVVYDVEAEVCGRKAVFEAIVEPRKAYALIGAIVMETLDLVVEPRGNRVYPNPRSEQPIIEIE